MTFREEKKVRILRFNLIMKLSLCTPDFDSFSFVLSNVEMPCHASLVSRTSLVSHCRQQEYQSESFFSPV